MELVLNSLSPRPTGFLSPREKPDFLYETHQGKIGVEHTLLVVGGERAMHRERERDNVAAVARALFDERHSIPLLVFLHVHESSQISKGRRAALATELCQLVESSIPEVGESRTLEASALHGPSLPPEFAYVSIWRPRRITRPNWQATKTGYEVGEFSECLKGVFGRKESKLAHYRQSCEECWLVIAALGSHPSSFVEFGAQMKAQQFDFDFDRAFLVQVFGRQVFELTKRQEGRS